MSASVRQRNLRGCGRLLRGEILAAAIRVIDQADSEQEVSLRRIAKETGIAAPSVYAHFEDREQLLEAVAEASWIQVCQEIADDIHDIADPRERLLQGCRVYVSFAQRFPLRYALMTQRARNLPAARQAMLVVTRGLLACSEASDIDFARMAASLSVALHGVAMLHRTDFPNLWLSDFSTDQILQTLVNQIILQLNVSIPNKSCEQILSFND